MERIQKGEDTPMEDGGSGSSGEGRDEVKDRAAWNGTDQSNGDGDGGLWLNFLSYSMVELGSR